MKMWMRPFLSAVAMGLVLAACDEAVTGPTAFDEGTLRADAAMVAADAMFQDLAHMQAPGSFVGIGLAPGAGGIQIEGSKHFSRQVTFYGANGPQDQYDPLNTLWMEIVSDVTRDVNHAFWSAEIERHREVTVTGLEGEETTRIWNGTGTGKVFRSRHPEGAAVKTYDMESSSVIDDVIRGVPSDAFPYPLSGTITRTIHVVKTVEGEDPVIRDVVAVITFDGDNTAWMEVGVDKWEINLDDRGVKKRFQKK